jgi:hypothetical protein
MGKTKMITVVTRNNTALAGIMPRNRSGAGVGRRRINSAADIESPLKQAEYSSTEMPGAHRTRATGYSNNLILVIFAAFTVL